MAVLTADQKRTLDELDQFVPGLKRNAIDENIKLGTLIERVVVEEFSDITRPSPIGNKNRLIFNTDEGANGALNVSNGTFWLTAAGAIT